MDRELRALADATRRQILDLVWEKEMTAGDIATHFSMSRPAISQHLAVLLDAGLIKVRPDATRRYYQVNPKSLAALRSMLEGFWDHHLRRLKQAAETEERKGRTNDRSSSSEH